MHVGVMVAGVGEWEAARCLRSEGWQQYLLGSMNLLLAWPPHHLWPRLEGMETRLVQASGLILSFPCGG